MRHDEVPPSRGRDCGPPLRDVSAGAVYDYDVVFFFQAEDGIRDRDVTGVQTCALPIYGIEPATLEARVLYDADRLDSLGASGVMRWAMTMKHGRWPETRTYHPDDPFAIWRDPDGQRYQLDRFFTKLLKLQEVMMTTTGRAMAAQRIAFLHLYLQELQHELAEAGSGYDLSEEVTYRLLWGKYRGEEQQKEQPAEDRQHVEM